MLATGKHPNINAETQIPLELSSIKAISKCEVNPTSGFQDIAFTNNCERMDGWTDSATDRKNHHLRLVFGISQNANQIYP